MPVAAEPFKKYKFKVDIDGFTRAGFQECGEIEEIINNIQYREGDDQNAPRNYRGLAEHGDLTLSRGMTADGSLMEWGKLVYDSSQGFGATTYKKNVTIAQMHEDGSIARVFNLKNAYPTSIKFGPWDAMDKTGVTVESMTLVYEGIEP